MMIYIGNTGHILEVEKKRSQESKKTIFQIFQKFGKKIQKCRNRGRKLST